MEDIIAHFERFFETVIADTPELVGEAKRLRYQVYCLEHQFEKAEDCREEREEDAYDARAVHGILRHRTSGQTVANVRLVVADPMDEGRPFPIEEHCGEAFDPDFNPEILPRTHVAEISRFAVSREFRKRRGEASVPDGLPEESVGGQISEEERRCLPHLTLGLFRAIVQLSRDHGVTHWYAVMEPRLIRSLRRFGINFPTIGSEIEYHGRRQPCLAVAGDLLKSVNELNPAVWGFITLRGALWPLDKR